jgi:twinkle protein
METHGGFTLTKTHQPCPECGSSKGLTIYDNGNTQCFACANITVAKWDKTMEVLEMPGLPKSLVDRNISAATVKRYKVTVEGDKQHYPYYQLVDGTHTSIRVAYKTRTSDKNFYAKGNIQNTGLFGMNVFPAGSSLCITVTEGECDAMAVYELMGSKYPAVSVKSSSSAVKDMKACYKYLDSFDKIYIAFDMDEPGQKAFNDIKEMFPGKVYHVKMRYKDANEYLKKNEYEEFKKDWWAAVRVSPESIISGSSMWEMISTVDDLEFVPYPWKGLNKLTYGMRLDEMITITAGSGMGKTQVMREMQHFLLKKSDYNVGCLMLEETAKSAAMGVVSVEANKILHLPRSELVTKLQSIFDDGSFDDVQGVSVDDDELKVYFDATLGTDRIHFYSAFGENNIDRLISNIRYMNKALGCRIIFLDHISILVSEQTNGDERKALDEIATKLKKLTMELNISLIMVSHAKRQATKPLEEGGSTSLSDIRGTAGIGQLSNIVLGLERNGQDPDDIMRNVTMVRVVKNRFTGLTGPACQLYYDRETGRLTEVTDEDLENMRELDVDEVTI